ncbi:hypothetical protein KY336_04475 [Candidatus Woesearchaeota archaeon]|nr:hypothetical protein [Candidatus Woesearchaeota archaeon]
MENQNLFVLITFVAIFILLIVTLIGNDYNPTGQGINVKLPKEVVKKMVEQSEEQETQSDVSLPPAVIKKMIQEAQEKEEEKKEEKQSESQGTCDCPDPFNGKIITKDWSKGYLTSLSEYDCLLVRYIAETREDLNLPPDKESGLIKICDWLGWGN